MGTIETINTILGTQKTILDNMNQVENILQFQTKSIKDLMSIVEDQQKQIDLLNTLLIKERNIHTPTEDEL